MLNLNWQIIWAVVNIAVLYFLMRKFLFRPVTEMMDKRQKLIEDSLAEADRKNAEADQLKAQYEEKLRQADETSADILRAARQRASKEADQMLRSAQERAQKTMEKVKIDLEVQRQDALRQMRESVADVALLAATQIVSRNMDDEINRQLVEDFLSEMGVKK